MQNEEAILPPVPLIPNLTPIPGREEIAMTTSATNSKKKRKGHRGGRKAAKKNGKGGNVCGSAEQRSGDGVGTEDTENVNTTIEAAELQLAPSVANSDLIDEKPGEERKIPTEAQSEKNPLAADGRGSQNNNADGSDPGLQGEVMNGGETDTVAQGLIHDGATTPQAIAEVDIGVADDVANTPTDVDIDEDAPGDSVRDNSEDAHTVHSNDRQTNTGPDTIADVNACGHPETVVDKADQHRGREEKLESCNADSDQREEQDLEENQKAASITGRVEESLTAVLREATSPILGLANPLNATISISDAETPIEVYTNDTSHSKPCVLQEEVEETPSPPAFESLDEHSSREEDVTESPPSSDSPTSSSPRSSLSSLTDILLSPISKTLFNLAPSPGKGLGLFATTFIPIGTRILSELPLLVLPALNSLCIVPAVSALSPTERETFFSLSHPEDEERDEELGVFLEMVEMMGEEMGMQVDGLSIEDQVAACGIVFANTFAIFTPNGQQRSGIFATATRINHSCIPNVYPSYNAHLNRLTVHATRDIHPGEELSTTYIPLCLPRAARNSAAYLGRYGFVCACRSCDARTGWGRRSEKRRGKMAVCDETVGRWRERGGIIRGRDVCVRSDEEALVMAKELVHLLDTEGIANMELVRWYAPHPPFPSNCGF